MWTGDMNQLQELQDGKCVLDKYEDIKLRLVELITQRYNGSVMNSLLIRAQFFVQRCYQHQHILS